MSPAVSTSIEGFSGVSRSRQSAMVDRVAALSVGLCAWAPIEIRVWLCDGRWTKRASGLTFEGMTTEPDTDIAALIDRVAFNTDGLVPAIAQQHDSGEVLMMAWMSRESLGETLRTGRVCYWSRSRQALWRKGESSGHVQRLVEARLDCDGDTLLLIVEQIGPACHTGADTCFFRTADAAGWRQADEGYKPALTAAEAPG